MMDPSRLYINRLRRFAQVCFEAAEEGAAADTRVLRLLRPVAGCRVVEMRRVVEECLAAPDTTVVDGAIALHKWHVNRGVAVVTGEPAIAMLRDMCKPFARERVCIDSAELRMQRAYLRLARYLYDHYEEDPAHPTARAHSRAMEYFIPMRWVLRGRSVGGTYHEHVVPCAFIRQHSIAMARAGRPLDDAAAAIRRMLAIVIITPEEQERLDRKSKLGLKDTMPDGWCPDTGSIYRRLEIAGITFAPETTAQA